MATPSHPSPSDTPHRRMVASRPGLVCRWHPTCVHCENLPDWTRQVRLS